MTPPKNPPDIYDTLDPEVREILEWNAAHTAPAEADIDELRTRHGGMCAVFDIAPAPVASVTDLTVETTRRPASIRVYEPVDPAPSKGRPALFFAHGGSWIVGSIHSHDNLCRQICAVTGVKVISAEYGLAPENPFPHQTEDVIRIYDWVVGHSDQLAIDTDLLILCGDSSGANLITVLMHELKQRNQVMPVSQVLIYPSVALFKHRSYPSWQTYRTGYLIGDASLTRTIQHYLRDEAHFTDPRVSPLLYEDFSGQPPALVLTAEHDPIRDGGREYAAKLVNAGVPTRFVEYPGTLHGFLSCGRPAKQVQSALDDIGTFVRHFI